MKTIRTIIETGIRMLLCCFCIIACTQEELDNSQQDYAGKAIEIMAYGPDNYAKTRAASEKESFNSGDIIHVSTTFKLIDSSTKDIYSCLKFDGNVWKEYGTKSFTWPWNATSASFTAYFIPAAGSYTNSDALTDGDIKIPLSELSTAIVNKGTDPLKATYTDVPAGSSVYLQFNHLFTKVTFTNLDADINDNEELRLAFDGLSEQITFTRNGGKLSHKLDNPAEPTGYLFNKCKEKEITFLLPELSANSKIKLSHRDMSPYHSFVLPQNLIAGKHYSINITKLADNFVSEDIKEEDWNSGIAVADLDETGIKNYLESIRDGEACNINGLQILITYKETDGTHVVAQIRDVNFQNKQFIPVNLGQTIIFQANNHKIKNLKITNTIQDDAGPDVNQPRGKVCKALFGKNSGTIKNLIIETASIDATTATAETYAGILVGENDGIIDNVRLQDITTTTTSASFVGIVAAHNTKTIQNCHVSGQVAMTINNSGKSDTNIGGLVGTTSGDKTIKDCSIQATNPKNITVEGSYKSCYVGGMVGEAQHMQACLTNLNVTVNSVTVDNTNLSVGGFAGNISQGEVANCTAVGNVSSATPGKIGGFAGLLQNSNLDDCASFGQVTADVSEGYSTGGLVGLMKSSTTNTKTSIIYSSATGQMSKATTGGLIGTVSVENGTKPIVTSSFCINTADSFIKEGDASITKCHQNGIGEGTSSSFEPGSDSKWTNTPAIYGKDTNGAPIYYLKRNL